MREDELEDIVKRKQSDLKQSSHVEIIMDVEEDEGVGNFTGNGSEIEFVPKSGRRINITEVGVRGD